MKLEYDKDVDALYVYFQEAKVSRSVDVEEGVVIDYDARGGVVGIEILDASARIGAVDCEGVGRFVRGLLANNPRRD